VALFKKREEPTPPPQVAAPPPTTLGEKIVSMSAAIDILVTGDWRDSQNVLAVQEALDAGMAPRHFPESSIWAKSIPFSDQAAASGEWLIIIKLYQLLVYWNDELLPQFRQSNPNFVELIGWARPADRATMREKSFEAVQHLEPRQVVFARSGETIGSILLSESTDMGRTVDWLASPVPPPPPVPTSRERIDAVIASAQQGDAEAVAFERALAAESDEESRRFLDEAASLGSVDAMEAAAEMAQAAGDGQSELFWAETAANAGSIKGMNRLVAILYGSGRVPEAVGWLQKAGQAGDDQAYALLARMANENGDHAAAQQWAEAGAQAGNAECMRMKASYILNNGGLENAALAHTWFVEAARRGSDRAMFQLSQLAEIFGNQGQTSYWLQHAASLGNPEATQQLAGNAPGTLPAEFAGTSAAPASSRADEWEYATIWYGQEADMKNLGQMMWSAQIKWPDQANLDLRDRVAIESVLTELSASGWELDGVEPASGIQAQDYRIRRRRH
jgi:hypothetical protein